MLAIAFDWPVCDALPPFHEFIALLSALIPILSRIEKQGMKFGVN